MSQHATARFAVAPYVASTASVARVMRIVIYALLPGITLYIHFFGWGVLINIALAIGSAILFEVSMLRIRGIPPWRFISDGSAILTALLLALSLPPMLPWWIPVLGSFIAIVLAKQLYGGLGYNPFNPAMAAFAVLLISFPKELSLWTMPVGQLPHVSGFAEAWWFSAFNELPGQLAFDSWTAATPLDRMRTDLALGLSVEDIRAAGVFGHWAGSGMEWVSLGYLAGGMALLVLRIISWHVPAAILLTVSACALIASLLDPQHSPGLLLHLLGGATILGAFFIATDPVTAATTAPGKLLYGFGIGVLIFAIRTWGGYPDGVAFAVLLAGMTVPLLDRYALPRVFGSRRGGDRVG